MLVRRFFHLDCRPIIPECRFRCAKCIEEIRGALSPIPGVTEVAPGDHNGVAGIFVQYDPSKTGIDVLNEAFGQLPSFYKGRFIPEVVQLDPKV